MPHRNGYKASTTAMLITPSDLIGAARVAEILGIDKSNVTRRAATGSIPVLAQLDGPGGVYVFNQPDIEAIARPPVKEEP
jgi:hypothetical protein